MKKKSKVKEKKNIESNKNTVKQVGNITKYDIICHNEKKVTLSIVLNITNRKLIQSKKKYSKNNNENNIYNDVIISTKNCIKNILNQTYKDYELIIVIDNMDNNIYNQISEYIQEILKDNTNITCIKLNKKLDNKMIGNMYANGKYITFIDNYNYVLPTTYRKMIKKIEEYPYDVIIIDLNLINKDDKIIRKISSNIDNNVQNIELEYKNILLSKMYTDFNNKVIKKEIMDKIMSNQDVSKEYEDIFLNFKLMNLVNSIAVVKDNLINLVYDDMIYEYSYYKKIFKAVNQINEYAKKQKIYETNLDIVEYLILKYIIYVFLDSVAKTRNNAMYKKSTMDAETLIKKLVPSFYQKNNNDKSNKNNKYMNNIQFIEKCRYVGMIKIPNITTKIVYLLNHNIRYGRYFK